MSLEAQVLPAMLRRINLNDAERRSDDFICVEAGHGREEQTGAEDDERRSEKDSEYAEPGKQESGAD